MGPETNRALSTVHATTTPVDPLSPRGAALAFTEGVRRGWRSDDLLQWVRGTLLEGGFVRLADPASGRMRLVEDKVGDLHIATIGERLPPSAEPAVRILVETARARVLDTLLAMKEPPRDDRFVNAALYAGRAVRSARSPRQAPTWTAAMTEGEPLSAWVLALFAADALENRQDYERSLGLCQECGAVSFVLGADRRRCAEHAEKNPPTSGVRRATRIA